MRRRSVRAVLVLSVASALSGCGDDLRPLDRLAVCPEPSSTRATSPLASADALFVLVDAPALSAEQERLLAVIRARPTSVRVHLARLAGGAGSLLQPDRQVTLDVSPTQSFTAVGTRVERRAEDDVSWSGRIVGEYGEVTLVLTGQGITGSLQSLPAGAAPAAYSIEPLGGGLQAIVCLDPSKFPPD